MKRPICKYLILLAVGMACKQKVALPINEYDQLIFNPLTTSTQNLSENKPNLYCSYTSINFGQAQQGDTVRVSYLLYNKGLSPLLISKVNSSCGCALTEILKNRIESGDSTLLNIIFTTDNKIGSQEIEFTILSNTNPTETKLQLIGSINQ